MRLVRALGWEFVQNLPMVAGFLLALESARRGAWLAAAAWAVAGSAVAAMAIALTESRIVAGHREEPRVVLINGLVMLLAMGGGVAYLAAGWSGLGTDVVLGGLAGTLMGVLQDLAAGERVGVVHCVALALAGAGTLVAVRVLAMALPTPVNILLLTGAITLVVGLMDYGRGSSARPGS
jgi:hypothetical protein